MFCTNTSRLTLQFHITGRCNLRCQHCYRTEGDVEPLSLQEVKSVIDQFAALCTQYNAAHGIKKRGHVNLTGGEPFFRQDIREILAYLGRLREQLTYGVLSNGSFLDEEMIGLLKRTEVRFVQLSIDGSRKTHDSLRAPGDYDRVLKTAQRLEQSGIRTFISFTANKRNFRQLPAVARQCRKRQITKLWSDRLVPIGRGEEIRELAITQKELAPYIRAMKLAEGSALTRRLYPKTQVSRIRALQFTEETDYIYSCSAGSSLITVDELGRVMPCRRMPILCGDIRTSSLAQIYWDHPVFQQLRGAGIPEECRLCRYAQLCRGGAKCQAYAASGSLDRADPACSLASKAQT